jgi:Fur family zinc uptake transcriptional regulator
MHDTDMAEPSRRRSGDLGKTMLRMLRRSPAPLTGIEIAQRLRTRGPRISNSQIFRTLQQLRRDGAIRKIEHLNGYAAGGDTRCVSLACSACGALGAVEAAGFFEAIDEAARLRGFRPGRYVVEVPGTCAACGAVKSQ